MPTQDAAKQAVIDAISNKAANPANLAASDTLYLAKAMQAIGAMGTSTNDVQALVASMLTAANVEAWLATPANAAAFTELLKNSAGVAYLFGHATAPAAVFASVTACNAIFGNLTAVPDLLNSATAFAALLASTTACQAMLVVPGVYTLVFASNGLCASFFASATACAKLFESPTVLAYVASMVAPVTAICASSANIANVLGSSSAVDTFFASPVFRLAFYNSDIALALLQATPTAVQRLIDSGRALFGTTAAASFAFTNAGVKTILLRRYYGGASEYDYFNFNRTTGNAVLPTGGSAYGQTGLERNASYVQTAGVWAVSNTAGANLVMACNGLQRGTWFQGVALNVYYLIV